MKFIGIDYGAKRIGLAFSDEGGEFAFPKEVIKCDKKAVERIRRLCDENKVTLIVLGESVAYNGKPNPIMKEIEIFKKELEKMTRLSVVYQVETLTTMESLRKPERFGPRGKVTRRREQELLAKNDASAAALILRSYLEARGRHNM